MNTENQRFTHDAARPVLLLLLALAVVPAACQARVPVKSPLLGVVPGKSCDLEPVPLTAMAIGGREAATLESSGVFYNGHCTYLDELAATTEFCPRPWRAVIVIHNPSTFRKKKRRRLEAPMPTRDYGDLFPNVEDISQALVGLECSQPDGTAGPAAYWRPSGELFGRGSWNQRHLGADWTFFEKGGVPVNYPQDLD